MADTPLILAVERNLNNIELLAQYLESEGYKVQGATTYEEFDEALEKPEALDLALVDVTGFDQEIWNRTEQLRTKGVAFLLISPRQSAALQKESIQRGARGVLVKPLVIKELLGVIRSLIEE